MTQTANARPSKVTWDWVRIDRGTLTRWRDVIPFEALPLWLQVFDTLTAEKHHYHGVAITDRRWLRWLGCRDQKHMRSTFDRLSKAGMVTLKGELVAAIPEVDAVWTERAEMSRQKQQNSQGRGGLKGNGEPPAGCDGVAEPSPPAADPATGQKGAEKQRQATSAVGRPTPQPLPLPLPTDSPSLLPRDQINGLVRSTTRAVQPETAKGLGSESARAPPECPIEPEPPTTPARASAALRTSELVANSWGLTMLAPITEPYNPHALTPQQEAFARAYVEHGNGSEAHRQAYPGNYGRRSRRGAKGGEQKKRGERARELLMKPKVTARIAEHNDDARNLVHLLRTRLDNLHIRHPAPRLQPSAPTAAPQSLAADQIADLARIAAREDMPASVRREALVAVWPQLETLRRALVGA